MPADLWTEAARMTGCGLLIAAGAVPVGLTAWFLARRAGHSLLPRPRCWPVPWTGFELIVLFPFTAAAPTGLVDPLLAAGGFYQAVYGADALEKTWSPMRPLWSAAVFAPLWIGFLCLLVRIAYPKWKPARTPVTANIAGAVGSWLVIHPVVGLVHFAVTAIFLSLDWPPDSHPLEQSFREGRPPIDRILFAVQVAIATPWLEEALFRGALLPWLLGKRHRPALLMLIATGLAFALSVQQVEGRYSLRLGPALFAAALLAGGALLRVAVRHHRRTVGAIYASAAFFAIVHSTVWPTPIPLFVLGLGLGWLAVRTRGILASTIVHGLFNAVSVLFVLRGS